MNVKEIEMKKELIKAYSAIRKSYLSQIEKFEKLESELYAKIDHLETEIFNEECKEFDRRNYAK